MQTVSADFTARTTGVVRRISHSVLISFLKEYDADTDFFTIGVSSIGGPDILKGSGSVIQESDKYQYEDYSNRVQSVEINRETSPPTNPISLATATIVLDNHDDIFTPNNVNSPLYGNLLVRRPVRIALGFTGELIPKFVGVTTGKPAINDRDKTATFQCIDFLKAIMDVPLDDEAMFVNTRTDVIIGALLERGGLDATQFDLDAGSVVIPFAYFPKGSKLGDGITQTAQAELGNLSMTEEGRPTFLNRLNWANNVASWDFSKNDILERTSVDNNEIINVVQVFSDARQVQDKQKLWETAVPIELAPGNNEIFADFTDEDGPLPVTTMDDPDYIDSATTSLYATNEKEDGTGATLDADISLVSTDLFSTSVKLVFNNTHSNTVFLTKLELFGTPAKVVNKMYIRLQDDASVGTTDGVEEHGLEIKNNLIQDEVAATSIALIIFDDRASNHDAEEWLARSVPQLQLGDLVNYEDENADEAYFVTRINDIVNNSGYRQIIRVSKRTINEYFRIGISPIGGTDVLGP